MDTRKHIVGKSAKETTWRKCECVNKQQHTHLLDYMFGHRCPCEKEATLIGDNQWKF